MEGEPFLVTGDRMQHSKGSVICWVNIFMKVWHHILGFNFQSGLLMSVIRTLSASESNEQRDREKAKLEKEYKRSDQKLDELVSLHDQDLTQVMQVGFWSTTSQFMWSWN
jgi:pantothenate kinase-related protein Tda10